MRFEVVQAVVLSLIPGLFWLWYISSLGRYRREPWWMMALACAAGAASTEGVLWTSAWLSRNIPGVMNTPEDPLRQLVYYVVAVGLMEEFYKMLAVRLTVYNLRSFDEPVDGLLYAGCSALGFATAENVVYILGAGDPTILVGRSILATFGHVLMSAVWGYALGIQKLRRWQGKARRSGPQLLVVALLISAAAHGLYDWLLMQGQPLLAVGVIAGLWWLFGNRIGETQRLSPYREHRVRRVRECSSCGILARSEAAYCTGCGRPMEGTVGEPLCGNCLSPAALDREACAHCGCHFLPELSD
ncbi:MAG: PrsW family glutamic-type intramembrane protease [Candidatus Eremiobacterota bacterium]